MRLKPALTIMAWSGLTAAGLLSLLMPQTLLPGGTAWAATALPPDVVRLTGTVRDFSSTHPDFGIIPVLGYGHYAGNIALIEGADGRPVFAGGGFKMMDQWRDRDLFPIAPHLYKENPTVKLVNAPTGLAGATVDSFNSSIGPYGGANVGPAPVFQTGAAMPTITVPPVSTWDQTLPGATYSNVTLTFDSNTRFMGDVKFEDNTIIQIDGQISILINGKLELDPDTGVSFQIVLLPDSTLDLYVTGRIRIRDSGNLNMNTGDPRLVTIYALGPGDFEMREGTSLAANIVAPDRTLTIDAFSHVYGRFTGQSIELEGGGGYHHDGTGADVCNNPYSDTAGTAGITSNGDITTVSTFDEWYRDVLGTNLSASHEITLTRNLAGVYEHLSSSFFPINNRLLGNEGGPNNNYFTFAFKAKFIYTSCVGQFFEFEGNDDAWLFVDGNLGIDLGGLVAGTDQYLDFDRMGLQDGQTYELHFFYAHRQPSPPAFNLRTSVELMGVQPTTTSAVFD